jgi:hypothetical protein
MIAAAEVIPTARRHITLKFIPYTPLESALRDRHIGEEAAAVATAVGAVNRHCRAAAVPRSLAQFISGSSLQVFDAYELWGDFKFANCQIAEPRVWTPTRFASTD